MIPQNATVQKRFYNKGFVRVGIESIKVGDYIRTVDIESGEYSYTKVTSIVKLTLPRYELTTTCFDTVYCTSACKFLCLNGFRVWSPSQDFDEGDRLVKRESSKLLTPFIKSCKLIGFSTIFYDILVEDINKAVLIDGYAKIYGN